jgi:hypothetical protein
LSFLEREVFVKTAVVSTIAVLLAATAFVSSASAATPTERRLVKQTKVLQKQVKALQNQVKVLQGQMTLRRRSNVGTLAIGALQFTACSTAATADAFQGTWEAIDRHAAVNAHGPDQFPPQTPIADPLNSCQLNDIQRQPALVPPTTNVFAALLNIFR